MPYVVINPDVEAILIQSPDFIHATNAGDRVLREGSIGTIAGLDVLVSTNLPTTTGKVNIMAGINTAIAYAGNISKIEAMRDNKFFGDNVRGLYVYGKRSFCRKPWPAWSLMCRRLIILIARPVAAVSRKMM